jgi:hypothetical protein
MADASKASEAFIEAARSVLSNQDEAARKQMLGAAMKAMAMLEAPLDTVWRMIVAVRCHYSQPLCHITSI